TVEKPEERGVIPASNELRIFWPTGKGPNESGFPHSSAPIATAPTPNSAALVVTVSLACRDHWRGWRQCREMDRITGKPSPPRNVPTMIGKHIHQSPV